MFLRVDLWQYPGFRHGRIADLLAAAWVPRGHCPGGAAAEAEGRDRGRQSAGGARGGSVARRAAKLLGWPVYDHESLDYLARDEAARAELLAGLPDGAKDWADAQADRLSVGRDWTPGTVEMVRLILTLAARGEAVLVGRGAGFLLPAESTIHVRVVAPLEQRIAYLGDLLRLPPAEAAAEVTARDLRREAFITSIVNVDPADVGGYDLVLNTGRLGEFAAAGLIVQAVVGRMAVSPGSSAEFELP